MQSTSDFIHLLSLNVQGLRNSSKRARLNEYILQQKANIVFLQETHFTTEIKNIIENDFNNYKVYNSYGRNTSRGCSIEHKLNAEIIDIFSDPDGRYILINIEIEKNIFSILNIYAPNDLRLRNVFFKLIDQLLKDYSLGLKLLAGDFNQTLSDIDRISKNKCYSYNISTSSLHKLIKSHKLNDIWRDMNKNKSQFTWRRVNSNEKSRIDFWLTDCNIRPAIFKTDIRPAQIKYTDHLAVSLKIKKCF